MGVYGAAITSNLRLSVYENGKVSKRCPICHTRVPRNGTLMKCQNCAQKIANSVMREYEKDIGHIMTEAIMVGADPAFVDQMLEGQKCLEITQSKAIIDSMGNTPKERSSLTRLIKKLFKYFI